MRLKVLLHLIGIANTQSRLAYQQGGRNGLLLRRPTKAK